MQFPTSSRIITQQFGENPAMYAQFGFPGHNGIDFAGALGDPIYAADAGMLHVHPLDPQGYGLYCTITHRESLTSYYCHLQQLVVKDKTVLKAGDFIGFMGNSGFSTGPHLHFGLRKLPYTKNDPYKGYIDPLPYLQETESNASLPSSLPQTSFSSLACPPPAGGGQSSTLNSRTVDKKGTAKIRATLLNIRSAPSIQAPVIGVLYESAILGYEKMVMVQSGGGWEDVWLCFGEILYIAAVFQGVAYVQLDNGTI